MALLVVLPVASCGDWSRIGDLIGGGHGGGQPSPPSAGPACWDHQLPPEVQPLPPKRPAAESCEAYPTAMPWTSPAGDTSPSFDARSRVVGRWIPCGSGRLLPTAHAGIEFGANGRWLLLDRDEGGTLVPVPESVPGSRGYYSHLSSNQLNIRTGDGMRISHVSFAAEMDLARFLDAAPAGSDVVYARTDPSPANGRDNLPTVSDGSCSMVGTWDLAATDRSPAGTFSFDERGNFVGGPPGADLCAAHTMYGTYQVTPGYFHLTENVNMGLCAWWYDARYPATFDKDCNRLSLTQLYDNCTGGRGYFNGETVLTRRR